MYSMIRVSQYTRDLIAELGQFGESFENVLSRVLLEYKKLKEKQE